MERKEKKVTKETKKKKSGTARSKNEQILADEGVCHEISKGTKLNKNRKMVKIQGGITFFFLFTRESVSLLRISCEFQNTTS